MIDWFSSCCLLADDQPASALGPLLPPLILIGVVWYFLLFRPQQRDKRKRDELLKTLKKNDRVVTIGGMIGTVANVTPDGKEVSIKVDDNTRIRMLRTSIQSVVTDEDEGGSSK